VFRETLEKHTKRSSAPTLSQEPRITGARTPPPIPPGRLVGRSREMRLGRRLLSSDTARLITLTGPAGVGKTHLALELARTVGTAFPEGVCFADLTGLRSTDRVLPAIASAFGIKMRGQQPVSAALLSTIGDGHVLLILDSFEHVLGAALDLADLLATIPGLKLLVTSQARLQLRWEHVLPVPPLALPEPSASDEAVLAAAPAVELFIERARASDPDFALTPANASAVAGIVAHLEGLPLAIELAAPRVRTLTPPEMLEWVQHRLQTLESDAPDLPYRHRSLRAAIAWSYGLLQAPDQRLFRGLAAFRNGWTTEAAETVMAKSMPGSDIVRGLSRLVDASMLERSTMPGDHRVRLTELFREFALEQLQASDEAATVGAEHAAYYAEFAERAEMGLRGPDQATWFARLDQERQNLDAALAWAAGHDDVDLELRLVGSLAYAWWMCGSLREGRTWLIDALARDPGRRDGLREQALEGAGLVATYLGEDSDGQAYLAEASEIARALGDASRTVSVLAKRATVARVSGRREDGWTITEELETVRAAADSWDLGVALHAVGLLAAERADYCKATDCLEESLSLCRDAGDQAGVARALIGIAEVAHAQGQRDSAAAALAEALPIARDLGASQVLAWWCPYTAVRVSLDHAPPYGLVRVLGGVDELRSARDVPLPPRYAAEYGRILSELRTNLGEAPFSAAWSEGRALPLEELVEATLAVLGPGADQPAATKLLSPREQEVLRLLADGATNKQIAATLVVTEATARYHVASLLHKLAATNRTQAVAVARHRGLI
jgi:predicted ATPase/DNA-binding CsgD family transcriptional regulator